MGNWGIRFREPEGEAWKCPTCGLMVTYGHKCQVRATVQCEDCKAMLESGLEAYHKCPKKLERLKAEKIERRKQRAKERKESGITPRAKMIKPKELMIFTEVHVDGYTAWTVEVSVEKNPWMCRTCGLVWQTKHEAEDCGYSIENVFYHRKPHGDSYTKVYGASRVENGEPKGQYVRTITFTALRRLTPDAKPEEIAKWKAEDEKVEQKRDEFEFKREEDLTPGDMGYERIDPLEEQAVSAIYDPPQSESPSTDEWDQ
jgi:hypothetical protein